MQSVSRLASVERIGAMTPVDLPAIAATVCVVGQDASLRRTLMALADLTGLRCEAFESASAFLSRPGPAAPHCLILDTNLPDFCVREVQTLMAGCSRGVPIIFITDADAIPTTVRAMKPDELEFLAEPIDPEDLRVAVINAIARNAQRRLHEMALDELARRFDSLTPREREVMELVVAGLQNKQAARRLDIAEITVKVHRGRVMEKMGAATFADLVKMSVQLLAQTSEAESVATTAH